MRNKDLRNDLAKILSAIGTDKGARLAWSRVVAEVAARHREQRETKRRLKRALFGLSDTAERIGELMGKPDAS